VFKRFRSGLFYPSEIINYRSERKITTVLYLGILVLLSMIPSFIIMFEENPLDFEDKRAIREAFRDEELPYKIENNQLIYFGDGEGVIKVEITDTLNVILTPESEAVGVSPFSVDAYIILTKEKVYYVHSLNARELFSYSDYADLENLDFSEAAHSRSDFWTTVFRIANDQLQRNAWRTNLVNMVGLLLVSMFSLLILGVIITFLQKLFNPYSSFGEIFRLMVYALTPHVIGQLLASLFGFSLLAIVGMIMTVIYASKLSRKLIQR
jgi:hypothetical protein